MSIKGHLNAIAVTGCIIGALLMPAQTEASWLSEITGVNVDIPNGRISLGPPRPEAIPQMLQNLPKDASQFFLNPAGAALATSIRYSEAQAQWGAQPIPQAVVNALLPFFPGAILQSVSWNVPDGRQTLDTVLLNDFNQGAVTLENIVVFKNRSDAETNPVLWAHELTHVLQYRQLGVETFAHLYTFRFGDIEAEARRYEDFVRQRLQQTAQQYWQTQPGWFGPPIAPGQYEQYARQFINPLTCSSWAWNNYVVTESNNCPIPIRVSEFKVRNRYTGWEAPMPCTLWNCTIQPHSSQAWVDYDPWVTSGVTIIW